MNKTHIVVFGLALFVSARLPCLSAQANNNNYPPPQSILPSLAGQPSGTQAVILAGKTDDIDRHLFATDSTISKQWAQINADTSVSGANADALKALSAEVDSIKFDHKSDQDKKDSTYWEQFFFNLFAGSASSGTILYHYRENKRKKRDEDED